MYNLYIITPDGFDYRLGDSAWKQVMFRETTEMYEALGNNKAPGAGREMRRLG